jgi:hypothetical protein
MEIINGIRNLTGRDKAIMNKADEMAGWLDYVNYDDMETSKLSRIQVTIKGLPMKRRVDMLAHLFGFKSFAQLYRYEKMIHQHREVVYGNAQKQR